MDRHSCALALCLALAAGEARAQEMEPKAYSASPVGANFLVVGYSWSNGSVLFDPTLPISNVQADVQGLALATGHSFNLFGKLALATVAVPIAWADVSGQVFEQATTVSRSGLADIRLKLSTNLRGNPAMSPREFARAPRRTIVGASLAVTAPTGQYFDTKLVNLGTNRWSLKPEAGVSWPRGRWDLDAYLGATFFTDNRDYFPGGRTRTQDHLLSLQGHLSYTFRPRLWLAADGIFYRGGSGQVDYGDPSTSLSNSRLGVTASMPAGGRYSFKVAFSRGLIVRTGTSFNTVAVAWQALWLSPRWSGR